MECIACTIQYMGKVDTAFNLRLNNYMKDTKKPNSVLTRKHFKQQGYNFNKHTEFIIIHKLENLHSPRETIQNLLATRQNIWLQKIQTLVGF